MLNIHALAAKFSQLQKTTHLPCNWLLEADANDDDDLCKHSHDGTCAHINAESKEKGL